MKKVLISIFICITLLLLLLYINNKSYEKIKKINMINNYINDKVNEYDVNGYLKIDKINLFEPIYNIDSKDNTLDNGLLLYQLNPYIILGHSGSGRNAIFNDLDKLEINDIIELNYNKNTLYFKITYKYFKLKSEKLDIKDDIILITCKKNTKDYQLVIRAKKV